LVVSVALPDQPSGGGPVDVLELLGFRKVRNYDGVLEAAGVEAGGATAHPSIPAVQGVARTAYGVWPA
jgi:hypothetical protein